MAVARMKMPQVVSDMLDSSTKAGKNAKLGVGGTLIVAIATMFATLYNEGRDTTSKISAIGEAVKTHTEEIRDLKIGAAETHTTTTTLSADMAGIRRTIDAIDSRTGRIEQLLMDRR